MKTITVTDEMYEFLVNTGREILTQDNRFTAKPIVFIVQTKHEEVRPEEYTDKHKIIDEEGNEIDLADIVECILDDLSDAILQNVFLVEVEEINDRLDSATDLSALSEVIDIDGYIKSCRDHWRHVYFDEEYRYGGEGAFFLTGKACKSHIFRNKHNYREPISYVEHAYRNPEIEQLCKFLTDLAHSIPEQTMPESETGIHSLSSFLNPSEVEDPIAQEKQ